MKKSKYILAAFLFFIVLTNITEAANTINIINTGDGGIDCSGLFTSDALDLISEILNWFRILAPILMILLTAVDFVKVIIADDPGASSKKIIGRFAKRAVAVGLVFLLPTIVRFILNMEGVRNAIQIPNDPLCGTMKSIKTVEEVY